MTRAIIKAIMQFSLLMNTIMAMLFLITTRPIEYWGIMLSIMICTVPSVTYLSFFYEE